MKKFTSVMFDLALASVLVAPTAAIAQNATPSNATHEIDTEVWSVIIETVAEGDIIRMGSVYSPDAVLIVPKGTEPIAKVLPKWGRDMVQAQTKGNSAAVTFRYSHRQDDPETAFESGIFQYTVIDKSGATHSQFYPFESLMVKKHGKWRILMEHQFAAVTQEAWDKLPQ